MSIKITSPLAVDYATAAKTALDGGFLILFSGTPVPATAADAIPGGGAALAKITKNGDGATGLTFETPTTGTMAKTAAEVWKCLGANVASGTPTFFRWVLGADDGTGAAGGSDVRFQGTIGTDPNTYDLVLSAPTLTSGTDVPIDSFSLFFPLEQ